MDTLLIPREMYILSYVEKQLHLMEQKTQYTGLSWSRKRHDVFEVFVLASAHDFYSLSQPAPQNHYFYIIFFFAGAMELTQQIWVTTVREGFSVSPPYIPPV